MGTTAVPTPVSASTRWSYTTGAPSTTRCYVQYLRDKNSYTVLLAHFRNDGFDQDVTLAQVFWLADGVRKFHVVATRPLTIHDHFSNFEIIAELKKRLRQMKGVTVEDQFNRYSRRFRKLFGLRSGKALDLLNQTVTIKEIMQLNDFVRQHMLEKTDAQEKIAQLQEHYENLKKWQLLQSAVADAEREHEAAVAHLKQLDDRLTRMRRQETDLQIAINSDETGRRLRELEQEIRFRKARAGDDYLALREWVRALLAGSKAERGFGYEVELEERELRRYGRQSLPGRIAITTETDFLRLIGKEEEFARWQTAVASTLSRFPQLEEWLGQHPHRLLPHLAIWDQLLDVCAYFAANPRPGLYLRELPLPVHTKFVEENQSILRQLLDALLPPEAVDGDETTSSAAMACATTSRRSACACWTSRCAAN